METRCFTGRRTLLGIPIVVIVTVIAAVMFGAPKNLSAQTTKSAKTDLPAESKGAVVTQEPVPPDHYDPDDAKTWPDVVNEDLDVAVRGQQLTIHFYRPRKDGPAIPAIYACGDGGWRGLAPRTAEQLAHIGMAVAGIDSKIYLRRFSSVKDPVTIKQLASDYADIAKALRAYAKVDSDTSVYVYGWSLGAGFAIAVGSDDATRLNWAGVISIGLPKQNQLVSGVAGNHANLNVEANALYGFHSQDLIQKVAPIPLVMIQSTSDTASPPKVGRELFATARDPKQYVLIKASNHRFSGARDEFYAALSDAVSWIREAPKASHSSQTAAIKQKSQD